MNSFIQPLQLGNRLFPNNIIQGPLAGVSCAPFRRLVTQYGEPAFTCTGMISCQTLIHSSIKSRRRFTYKAADEGAVCFQLAGSAPDELALAAQIATDCGADLIDLNCGCPVKKIRSKGAGSKLLSDPARLYHLISAMKRNTTVPVSVKIRVAGNSDEKFNQTVANVIQDAGADFVIVHGRHWTESYAVPCRFDEIAFFVDALTIPVIGNGDIACQHSLQAMFATGCAGVMVSRASVGQPWLIKKLIAQSTQTAFVTPDFSEVGRIFIEHITDLATLLDNEKVAILQARKLTKYYARALPDKVAFCDAVNACDHLQDFNALCLQYFSGATSDNVI